jgi:plastocyanin
MRLPPPERAATEPMHTLDVKVNDVSKARQAGDPSVIRYTRLAAAAAAVALTASPALAQWGTLKGKFIYDGKAPNVVKLNITKDQAVCGQHNLVDESLVVSEEGGLANVVIYVRDKKVKVHPDYAATADDVVKFDNEHCRFEPHVLTVRLSQTLALHNSDPIGHNSNLQPLGDTGINPLLAAGGEPVTYKFKRAQTIPQPVSCNIHPWMKGWILPRDNPYMAVSDKDGSFEIQNLPAGKLEFQAWQEKAGYLEAKSAWKKGRFELTIKEGENDLGEIKVNPKLFDKK